MVSRTVLIRHCPGYVLRLRRGNHCELPTARYNHTSSAFPADITVAPASIYEQTREVALQRDRTPALLLRVPLGISGLGNVPAGFSHVSRQCQYARAHPCYLEQFLATAHGLTTALHVVFPGNMRGLPGALFHCGHIYQSGCVWRQRARSFFMVNSRGLWSAQGANEHYDRMYAALLDGLSWPFSEQCGSLLWV
jgi:hypothetical protein